MLLVFLLLCICDKESALAAPDNVLASQNKSEIEVMQSTSFVYTTLPFTHGESPVWDPEASTLYWVDVLRHEVHFLNFTSEEHRFKKFDHGEINIVVPIRGSRRLLVAARAQLFIVDVGVGSGSSRGGSGHESDGGGSYHRSNDAYSNYGSDGGGYYHGSHCGGSYQEMDSSDSYHGSDDADSGMRLLATIDEGPAHVLNEGKADALGRFWGGTKGPQSGHDVQPDKGSLYCVESPRYRPRVVLRPVSISNGLTWSLNNSLLYYIDSLTKKIDAFDFDLQNGEISRRRTILDISEHGASEAAIPDGMTIDRDGMLWVALMFQGTIIRIDPDARAVMEAFHLPVSQTTSLTWAGRRLEELVVTTSRRNMDAAALRREPLAGAIFVLRDLGTGGVPDHKFFLDHAERY